MGENVRKDEGNKWEKRMVGRIILTGSRIFKKIEHLITNKRRG